METMLSFEMGAYIVWFRQTALALTYFRQVSILRAITLYCHYIGKVGKKCLESVEKD